MPDMQSDPPNEQPKAKAEQIEAEVIEMESSLVPHADSKEVDAVVLLADLGITAAGGGPIVSAVLTAVKGALSFRDKFLVHKIKEFLLNVKPDPEKKLLFAGRLVGDPAFRERVGEQLFSSLDSMDDSRKARYLGVFFSALMEQRIDLPTFGRFNRAVFYAHFSDIEKFVKHQKTNPPHILEPLAMAGLVTQRTTTIAGQSQLVWKVTDLGTTFVDLLTKYSKELWHD